MTNLKSERREQWRTLTRQAILEAVVRLISHHGIQGLTMDKVAAEAAVSKGTIYVYFKDKNQLLTAVKDFSLQPLSDQIHALLDGDLPPVKKIERLVACHLEYFDAHREFFRVFLLERQDDQVRVRRQKSSRFQDYVDRVAAILAEGTGKGLFKTMAPGKVAAMLVETEISVSMRRILSESRDPVEEDARLLVEVFLRGISTSPPRTGRKA